MPPKIKLPRRVLARTNELNLETASNERIDAITAEPLDSTKYIEILSPDATLRLFYNTSTLIRIATDKGGFMQPPHFREPMLPSLQLEIEQLEGKKLRFEAKDRFLEGSPDGSGGMTIQHRHVYFEQIMDEFYHLNPADVFVCPICYDHYAKTRYIPSSGRPVEYINGGTTAVLDPVDVIAHMSGEATDSIDEPDSWDTPLAHIVFRRANYWIKHMNMHHAVQGVSSRDYTLRDMLCNYHSHFNQLSEEKYKTKMENVGSAKKRLSLTQQRYWSTNARYNCLRYNRIVEAASAADGHPESVNVTAFPVENIAVQLNPVEEENSNFIVDDDEESGDDFAPHYSPAWSEKSEKDDVERCYKRRRPASTNSTSSSTDSTREFTSTEGSVVAVTESMGESKASIYQRGLLSETAFDERLSAEDRRFIVVASQKSVTPTQLYDPIMHRESYKGCDEDIDFENIGGTLEAVRSTAKEGMTMSDSSLKNQEGTLSRSPFHHKARLLLDEDE